MVDQLTLSPTKAQSALQSETHVVPIEIAAEGTDTENFVQMRHLRRIRPTALRVSFLISTSSASFIIVVFVKPDLHPISLLEVTEDPIDGLGHNLLQLFVTSHAAKETLEP